MNKATKEALKALDVLQASAMIGHHRLCISKIIPEIPCNCLAKDHNAKMGALMEKIRRVLKSKSNEH